MIQFVGSLFSLVGMIVGDAILSKWIGVLRFYLDKQLDAKYTQGSQTEYASRLAQMQALKSKDPTRG